MPIYLGIDGGGTKTTCAVGDDHLVLTTATGAGSNVVRVGEAQARLGLEEAIGNACMQAGISPLDVDAACVGAAGAARPDVEAILRRILSEACPRAELQVVGDMVIALEAVLSGMP